MENLKHPITLTLLALTVVLGLVASRAAFAAETGEGASAPDFEFAGPDHKTHQLSELRGHVVVLDFWQSWCGVCRSALPSLEAVNQKLRDEDVLFLGVNDEDRETINRFTKALRLHFFTISDDNDDIAKAFNVTAIPYTVVIGRDGQIVETVEGFDGNENLVRKAVERALARNQSRSGDNSATLVDQ